MTDKFSTTVIINATPAKNRAILGFVLQYDEERKLSYSHLSDIPDSLIMDTTIACWSFC